MSTLTQAQIDRLTGAGSFCGRLPSTTQRRDDAAHAALTARLYVDILSSLSSRRNPDKSDALTDAYQQATRSSSTPIRLAGASLLPAFRGALSTNYLDEWIDMFNRGYAVRTRCATHDHVQAAGLKDDANPTIDVYPAALAYSQCPAVTVTLSLNGLGGGCALCSSSKKFTLDREVRLTWDDEGRKWDVAIDQNLTDSNFQEEDH